MCVCIVHQKMHVPLNSIYYSDQLFLWEIYSHNMFYLQAQKLDEKEKDLKNQDTLFREQIAKMQEKAK